MKKARVFVTSDSSKLDNYFQSRNLEIFTNDGPVEHTALSNTTHNGMLKVFADFIILSGCEYIITSPGTFGVSAALAGGAKRFYRVSNDASTCSRVQCGMKSMYCSFSWSGIGITWENDVRSHLSPSQLWEPYIAASQSGSKYRNKKIMLSKLKDNCS